MALKFRMKLNIGWPLEGSRVPDWLMPSQSSYGLDKNNLIEAHQIDVGSLLAIGFILIDQPRDYFPEALNQNCRI